MIFLSVSYVNSCIANLTSTSTSTHHYHCSIHSLTTTSLLHQENVGRLFKEVVQFNPNMLQGGGGSGLGMVLSSGIIEAHGGSIWMTSEGIGRGCTFAFALPLSNPHELTSRNNSLRNLNSPSRSNASTPANRSRVPSQTDLGATLALEQWEPRTSTIYEGLERGAGEERGSERGGDGTKSPGTTEMRDYEVSHHLVGQQACLPLR
jgi:hypothetical protein